MELVELQKSLAEFDLRSIRVVAVSVDQPDKLAVMQKAAGASFDFLSDADGKLLDLLDVRHLAAGPAGEDVAQSASFLIAPNGRVMWRQLAPNYRVRPRPEYILKAFDALPRN